MYSTAEANRVNIVPHVTAKENDGSILAGSLFEFLDQKRTWNCLTVGWFSSPQGSRNPFRVFCIFSKRHKCQSEQTYKETKCLISVRRKDCWNKITHMRVVMGPIILSFPLFPTMKTMLCLLGAPKLQDNTAKTSKGLQVRFSLFLLYLLLS